MTHVAVTRDLHLTSPLTRGHDVAALQTSLNDRIRPRMLVYGGKELHVDGVFGQNTHHAFRVIAYELGLTGTYEATHANQTHVRWPWTRSPADLVREHQRKEEALKARIGVSHGLAGLPAIAAKYIGVAESPPGSNGGRPHPLDWEEACGFSYGPWCAAFASAVVRFGGGHLAMGYCPNIEAGAKAGTGGLESWVDHHSAAAPGYLVLYAWDGSGTPEHVGVVESLQADHLVAVEGNTSGSNPSDGGMVARMVRSYSNVVGYARPRL